MISQINLEFSRFLILIILITPKTCIFEFWIKLLVCFNIRWRWGLTRDPGPWDVDGYFSLCSRVLESRPSPSSYDKHRTNRSTNPWKKVRFVVPGLTQGHISKNSSKNSYFVIHSKIISDSSFVCHQASPNVSKCHHCDIIWHFSVTWAPCHCKSTYRLATKNPYWRSS